MAAAKEHKKKKKKPNNKKTLKQSIKQQRKDGSSPSEPPSADAARKRNPKAFVFSSRGKAKVQKARSAEKEQRRMHGESCQLMISSPSNGPLTALSATHAACLYSAHGREGQR